MSALVSSIDFLRKLEVSMAHIHGMRQCGEEHLPLTGEARESEGNLQVQQVTRWAGTWARLGHLTWKSRCAPHVTCAGDRPGKGQPHSRQAGYPGGSRSGPVEHEELPILQ